MGTAWKPLGGTAPGKLAKTHFQPYQLSQWLARFSRGYLEPVPDDSHTSLEWRRDRHIMRTGAVRRDGRRLALGLNPRDLTLLTVERRVPGERQAVGNTRRALDHAIGAGANRNQWTRLLQRADA